VNVPSLGTSAKSLDELGSVEIWSLSLETASIEAPELSLPVFGAAVNFERVILIPFWASDASLVRMRSRELSVVKKAQTYTRTRAKKEGT